MKTSPSAVGVTLNQTSATVAVGTSKQFRATVTGTTNTAVTWSVDGTVGGSAAAGTISASGLYRAPATAGHHTVRAASAAVPSVSANAAVTVSNSSAISPASATLNAGTTQQFSATFPGLTNPNITWTVNAVTGGNATVGTISSSGLYTAPTQSGTYTISASANGITVGSNAIVTVSNASSVSPASVDLAARTVQQFTANFPGLINPNITWMVDNITEGNPTVGTITSSGMYTAPSQVGTHTVSASAGSVSTASNAQVSVFTIAVSVSAATVAPSAAQQFQATIQGIANTAVTWSVDNVAGGNSATGTITTSGLYSAPSALGQHTITATAAANSTASASASLTVVNSLAGAVLTYHNDDARDGAFTQETSLTTANVNSAQFGKLASYPVDGQIYGQPLYLPSLTIAGDTHDVVYVATQNDSVYAFDADASPSHAFQTFWHVSLGTHVTKNDYSGVSPNVGILSTPVIDATTNTFYVVVESSTGPLFTLHALDATTGAEKFGGPVSVTGSVPGTGLGSSGGNITLESDCYQRMGLALNPVTNAIYIPFGSCSHGWILAYDKISLQQIAIFNDTPDGAGGGLWASGGATAIDDTTGDLYLMSGVDAGDQNYNPLLYNDSFLRLDPNNLNILDFFAPDNNSYLAHNDADLGSGALVFMPDNSSSTPHEVIGGGKDGRVFVVNRDSMGSFLSNANNVIQTVPTGTTQLDNIFSTPVYWNGLLYYHCNNDSLKAYSWSNGLLSSSPTAAAIPVYGMHGATASLSANGTTNGIIWDVDDSAYSSTGAGSGAAVLHAYSASDVSVELYDSSQAGTRDTAGAALKFTVPTIAGGKVFIGLSSELDIYGLLNP